MMEYYLILKGHNKFLAKAELESLWKTYFNESINLEEIKNVIYKFSSKFEIENSHEIFKRVTYTNFFSQKILTAKNIDDFDIKIKKFDLDEYSNQTFLVRIKKAKRELNTPYTEKDLAEILWKNIENPKVSMSNPNNEFDFLFLNNNESFIFTKKIFENEKDYLERMPTKRPISMPYTLKSDMSRCAINLLELKEGKILDPFCGIGGILLEAYDMGFKIIGNDISWNDLKYFKTNFNYYFKNENCTRILSDSTKQFLKENTIDGIVTDIPYGKCCRKLGANLYEEFLINAKKYLKKDKKMVIIYANFVEFKEIALKYFTEILEVEEYINKSMTRKILVLKNKK